MTQAVWEENMGDDNTQWSWTDDMRKRIAEEMVLHVDLDDNGITEGSDLTEAAKRLSEDAEYREEFERLVAIARNVVRDVVG